MVLNDEDGLECEDHVDGVRLEHVSEFKYLGKLASERSVAGAIRSLVDNRDLQLESCMSQRLCLF